LYLLRKNEETLSWLVKDLRKEEEEANNKRGHGMKFALLATEALTIVEE
jgi:hypothetical protein